MPVPTHFKFVFRGEYELTPETWSFGFHMSRDNESGLDAGTGDIVQANVTTALTTFFNTNAAMIPDNAKATDWRCYVIGEDGRMEGNPLVVDVSTLSLDGSTAMKYPPQVACVVTTVGADRGLARFGRFYLPTAGTIGTDSRMGSGTAQGIAEAASTFMKDVSNAVDLELTQSSEGLNISAAGAGARQTIDHIECGRVLDTLRSRRRAMVEERYSTGHIDW